MAQPARLTEQLTYSTELHSMKDIVATPSTPTQQQLAIKLRQLRERAGLTQAQLADAFSVEPNGKIGSATISSWENVKTAASPPEMRLEPYARLLAVFDSRHEVKLIPQGELSTSETEQCDALYAELKRLWNAARGTQEPVGQLAATNRSWYFEDDGPLSILCPEAPPEVRGPLADPADPHYTQAHGYADVDALIELFGHIRAENSPSFRVKFLRASEARADDLSGHLVILGGIAWNGVMAHLLRLLDHLPVRQERDVLPSGEIFAVGHGKDGQQFLPEWESSGPEKLVSDVGLLARLPNPFNIDRTLTLCNGIYSRGVLGAVRLLTDLRVRDANEAYLAERFGGMEFAILVKIPVVQGEAISPNLRDPANRLYEWSGSKRIAL
jgi:transcriptional regulator with XRE-family HTH domain